MYIPCTHFLFSLENIFCEVNTYLWGRLSILLVLIKNELIKYYTVVRSMQIVRLGYCKLRNDKDAEWKWKTIHASVRV